MHPRSVSEQFATAQPRSSAGRDSVSGLSRPAASSSGGGSDHNHNHSSRNKTITSIPPNLLPSAPASPPTPAPSPTPHQRPLNWQSSVADDDEDDAFLVNARMHFSSLPNAKKQKFLMGILGLCDSKQLSFVSSFVSPRLRKDPFMVFPNELCLRVRLFVRTWMFRGADLVVFSLVSRYSPSSTILRPSQEHPKYRDTGGNC